MFRILLFYFIAFSFVARAEPHSPASLMHFGYSLESSPYKGFKNVGGSNLAFDFLLPGSGEDWGFGFQTLAGGGTYEDKTFYRLSSGPLLYIQATPTLRVLAQIGFFRESLQSSGSPFSASKGLNGNLS